jgi:pyridoxal biosynthesis lyase PdxS
VLVEVSRGLGAAMAGIETTKLADSELLQTRGW